MMLLKDQKVQFKIRDVYHPDPQKVLIDLHGDDLLTGKVIDLSDSGIQKDVFVVVEVEGVEEPLIVPIERILDSP
jgi:hypothetical protein